MTEMNFEAARHNMIEQQIRPWDVLDQHTLDLLEQVPRENFVPAELKNSAFSDLQLPIGRGEVMMEPKVEAKILQALNVCTDEVILEVGTGSGYMTALLATLGKHVYTVELVPEFKIEAQKKLSAAGLDNVTYDVQDAAQGFDRHGPYDVIVITGSLPVLPDNFKESLNVGGRLFAIIGEGHVMEATLITRVNEEQFAEEVLFETEIAPLKNAVAPKHFDF